MHVDTESPQGYADSELEKLHTEEEAILRRVKELAHRLSERVRDLLSDDTDVQPPLPSSETGTFPAVPPHDGAQ